MNQTAENLRYLLYKQKGLKKSRWVERLAEWASCDSQRARELLDGSPLKTSEQKKIAKSAERTEEDLQHARLVNEENVLRENIRFLTDKMSTVKH